MGNSSLRLEEKGDVKLLTTSEGTVYTFAPFLNGEFHCSRISSSNGGVINLNYRKDASIKTIVDVSAERSASGMTITT